MRRVLVAAVALAAVAAFAGPARATNECRGLQVCIHVPGPWVVVPVSRGVPRPRAEFQLTCPKGYIVGGLDAELSVRALDVSFLGALGSPVNPGVTTSGTALFSGTYLGAPSAAPSYRPHIGCMPTSGGGGRIPTVVRTVFPAGKPTARRVKTVRVPLGGSRRAVLACRAGEQLVAASHAVGFYGKTPPGAALATAVRTSQSVRGNRVTVVVRGGVSLQGRRAIVQVGAVCAGGQ